MGVAFGSAQVFGVSLALACDVVLASEKSFFMLAFTKIGLMPDGAASALIAAAVGRIRAMRMALLAERITADEAYAWGLVSQVYPADALEAEAATVIETLAASAGVTWTVDNAVLARYLTAIVDGMTLLYLNEGDAETAGAAIDLAATQLLGLVAEVS